MRELHLPKIWVRSRDLFLKDLGLKSRRGLSGASARVARSEVRPQREIRGVPTPGGPENLAILTRVT